MPENIEEQKAYSDKLHKAAKLLSENTMYMIGCIVEKHDAAIIEVGLEMRQQIKDLEDENRTLRHRQANAICWQTIDTFPRNGQDVLVFTEHGEYAIAHSHGLDDFAIRNGARDLPLGSICKLTHWMPLPRIE